MAGFQEVPHAERERIKVTCGSGARASESFALPLASVGPTTPESIGRSILRATTPKRAGSPRMGLKMEPSAAVRIANAGRLG